MAKEILLLSKCLGMRTKGKFLGVNLETGESEIAEGMNVFTDKEGKIRRRDGRRVLSNRTGRKDGFGSGSGDCLVKCGTSLFRMGSDFGLTGLRSGMTEGKCSFSKQGKNTYYCDGVGNGVVEEGGASRTWVPQSYVGPDTIKVYSAPPVGNLVCYYNSREYVALGSVVYYSDILWPSGFDASCNFIEFDSEVVLLRRFEKGLVVGTLYRTYVMVGNGPGDFYRKVVDLVGPFADSGVEKYQQVGDEFFLTTVWTSLNGVFVVDRNGMVSNLLVDKIDLGLLKLTATSATVWDNYYIVSGSPVGLVVNMLNGAVSLLSNFCYTTLFECFGSLVGGDANGLYELFVGNYDCGVGGEEEDVEAWIKLPKSDWGISNQKGIRTLYVSGEFEGIEVTSKADNGESTVSSESSLYNVGTVGVNPGCNLQGCNWEFMIRNVEGGKFDIDAVSCLPVIKGKRILGLGK